MPITIIDTRTLHALFFIMTVTILYYANGDPLLAVGTFFFDPTLDVFTPFVSALDFVLSPFSLIVGQDFASNIYYHEFGLSFGAAGAGAVSLATLSSVSFLLFRVYYIYVIFSAYRNVAR